MATYKQLLNLEIATINLLEAIKAGETRLNKVIEAVNKAMDECPNYVIGISEAE